MATESRLEVHDPRTLQVAAEVLDACRGPREMAQEVVAAVERNAAWRGRQCLNLLAPEAPTSPTVRALLSAEIGTRAAEGHIGAVNRWFAGTRHIDEVEALCMELLKRALRAEYADHRLCASMIGSGEVPVPAPLYANVLPLPAAMFAARFAWASLNSSRNPFSTVLYSLICRPPTHHPP